MHPALAPTLLAALLLGQAAPLENLDFSKKTLEGWDGKGFVLTGSDPVATSNEVETKSAKGMIRFVLHVPPGALHIRFKAHAVLDLGCEPDARLDVLLAGAGNKIVPKMVRTDEGWSPTSKLLGTWKGKSRDYSWDVSGLAGKMMQIVIVDQDDRPGCYVVCGGFHIVRAQEAVEPPDGDFLGDMTALQVKYKLNPLTRFDSKRFTALGNASDKFMTQRLRQCEVFYDLFFHHFHRKGFTLHNPAQPLKLAVFDSPVGFEAYMGQKMPSGATGLYHPLSNCLVLYDLSENRGLVAHKNKALKEAGKIGSSLQRGKFIDAIEKQMTDISTDLNLTTTMHEAAHQLSFNCGLLNRHGDVAVWLAEGLACYCEATDRGEWKAIGAPNPGRIADLARARGKFITLEQLAKDNWRDNPNVLLGYAQSWALFRMLLHERPQALQAYLALIFPRRTPDYRAADFRQSFGPDLAPLERRYQEYLREMVELGKK